MKKHLPSKLVPALLALASTQLTAQQIDLDDITMTVVRDGMFEARQLDRPDTEAIRSLMESRAPVQNQRPTGADNFAPPQDMTPIMSEHERPAPGNSEIPSPGSVREQLHERHRAGQRQVIRPRVRD